MVDFEKALEVTKHVRDHVIVSRHDWPGYPEILSKMHCPSKCHVVMARVSFRGREAAAYSTTLLSDWRDLDSVQQNALDAEMERTARHQLENFIKTSVEQAG